jgi:hypothetical protein
MTERVWSMVAWPHALGKKIMAAGDVIKEIP